MARLTSAAPPERMSGVDRAWLEMDEARNPMVVSAVLELENVASVAQFARTLAERLLRYPRFRERADDAHAPPRWLPDEDFSLGYHLRVRRLPRWPRGGDEAALREAIGTELTAELDRARPLWRVLLFPRGQRRVTALFRAHHALADGIALVQVLMSCTDAATRSRVPAASAAARAPHAGPIGGLIDRLEAFNALLDGLKHAALEDLRHPQKLSAQWRAGRDALGAVGRVLTLPQNNPPMLRQRLSGRRAVAWIDDLPFAPLHRLAQRLGVKLNDLFMTALAGAFGDVLRAQGVGMPDTQNLRVSIPVNLRNGNGGGVELGNCFGLVLLDLPIAVQDPLRCLKLVSARMQALKNSPEAKAVLASLAAAGHLPVAWEKKLVGWVGGKAAAVVSNLPGPARALKLAGARLRSLVFWPPQTGGIGLGVSLFSYAGRVSIGVSADCNVLPRPQALVEAFVAELDELRRLVAAPAGLRRARMIAPLPDPQPPSRAAQPSAAATRWPALLAALFALEIAASGWGAWYLQDWAMENLLSVLTGWWLLRHHRREPFSKLAYLLLFLFGSAHELGSHYTYSQVPYENWFRALFDWSPGEHWGLARNHYDRVVHFLFGLLCYLPMRELLRTRLTRRGAGSYALPAAMIVTVAALYELLEWLAVLLFDGKLGQSYLGMQGDLWDSQKDVAVAIVGVTLAAALHALVVRLAPRVSTRQLAAERRAHVVYLNQRPRKRR